MSMACSIDIAEDLTCPICLSIFNKPKTLPCQHTFCATCINGVINITQDITEFLCPVCKAITEIPESGSEGLKDNILANSLVEKYHYSREKTSFCRKHFSQELNLFCVDCKEILCATCMLSGHKKHNLASPSEGFNIIDGDIRKHARFVAKKLSTGKVRIQEMENAKISFGKELEFVSAAIADHFETIRKRAKAKESEILAKVRQEGEATMSMLNVELQNASSHLESVEKSFEAANHFLDARHDVEKFGNYSQVKGQLMSNEWLQIAPRMAFPRLITKFEDVAGFKVDVHIRSSLKVPAQIAPFFLEKAELVRRFKAFDEKVNHGEGGISFLNDFYFITNKKKCIVGSFCWDDEIKRTFKLNAPLDVTSNEEGKICIIENAIKGIIIFDKFVAVNKVLKNVYTGESARIACDNNKIVVASDEKVVVLDWDGKQLMQSRVAQRRKSHYSCHSPQCQVAITNSGQIFGIHGREIIQVSDDCDKMDTNILAENHEGFSRAMCCDEWGNLISVMYEGGSYMWGARKNVMVVKSQNEKTFKKVQFESGTMEGDDVCGITASGPGEVSILEIGGDVKVYKYLDL